MEIMELPKHPWFLSCQFHPEFRSKPFAPHPLFVGFIEAALSRNLEIARNKEKQAIPVVATKESRKFTRSSSANLRA